MLVRKTTFLLVVLVATCCSCIHRDEAVKNYYSFRKAYQARDWVKASKYVAKKNLDFYKKSIENDDSFKMSSSVIIGNVLKVEEIDGKKTITLNGKTNKNKMELEGIAVMVKEDGIWKVELDDWHPSAIGE